MILRTLQNQTPEFVTTPWFTGQSGAAQLAFGGFAKLGMGFVGLDCKALSTPALPVCVGDPLTSSHPCWAQRPLASSWFPSPSQPTVPGAWRMALPVQASYSPVTNGHSLGGSRHTFPEVQGQHQWAEIKASEGTYLPGRLGRVLPPLQLLVAPGLSQPSPVSVSVVTKHLPPVCHLPLPACE